MISQHERVKGSVKINITLTAVANNHPKVVKKPPRTKLRILSTVLIDLYLNSIINNTHFTAQFTLFWLSLIFICYTHSVKEGKFIKISPITQVLGMLLEHR